MATPTEIDAKMEEIKGLVTDAEAARIKAKMGNPERVLCPLIKRYAELPLICTGYQHVCMYLNRGAVSCNHPEKKEWQKAYSSPTVTVYTR